MWLLLALLQPEPTDSRFMFGAAGGYIRNRGSQEGAWYAGLMARLRVSPLFGVEATATIHRWEFDDEDIQVWQTPVQASLLLFPFRHDIFRPYALAGAGWYPTRVSYRDDLEALDEERDDTLFGIHIAAGAEMQMGDALTSTVDFRYIFMDEPDIGNTTLDDEEFDSWQLAIGVAFLF